MSRVPLPAGTALGRSFEYGLDVNVAPIGQPKDWRRVRRISGFQPSPTPKTFDAQTYDDEGADNAEVTGWSWALAFTVQVNRDIATGVYLPEVEAILARTRPGAVGEGAIIEVRWYHKPSVGAANPTDAGQGFATVAVTRQNTGPNGEVEALAVTLTGKGTAEQITNPFTGWGSSVPVLTSLYPQPAAVGEMVTITGEGLLGTTAVKFGTTSAPEFVVIGPATLVAVVPVGATAGSLTVTTAGGDSNTLPFATA